MDNHVLDVSSYLSILELLKYLTNFVVIEEQLFTKIDEFL